LNSNLERLAIEKTQKKRNLEDSDTVVAESEASLEDVEQPAFNTEENPAKISVSSDEILIDSGLLHRIEIGDMSKKQTE
jgi:hypothetical protein